MILMGFALKSVEHNSILDNSLLDARQVVCGADDRPKTDQTASNGYLVQVGNKFK